MAKKESYFCTHLKQCKFTRRPEPTNESQNKAATTEETVIEADPGKWSQSEEAAIAKALITSTEEEGKYSKAMKDDQVQPIVQAQDLLTNKLLAKKLL